MKIDDNGTIREMTEEEIEAMNREKVTPQIDVTLEDLQEAILELAEMIGGAE